MQSASSSNATPTGDIARRYLVVGAGPSGLVALRHLLAFGIEVDCLEQGSELGGNWCFGASHSSIYASTHLISSKRMTEFPDFRMPREYPHYPAHQQVLDYLRSYADQFGLRERIQFGSAVESIEPSGNAWQVGVAGEQEKRRYAGVVVANGHHWSPLRPTWPGTFAGEIIHAHDYKRPDVLRGKRVLVVGAGNSGCDIAVESALHARSTALSMRRGYFFLPKYLCGVPLDRCGDQIQRWYIPRLFRNWFTRLMLHVAVGPPERYGLPRPDHPIFATHPIVNSQLPYFVGHGAIAIRRDVVGFEGERVRFADGQTEAFDLVVLATGYEVRFPFFASTLLDGETAARKLYLHAFHADYENLCVIGLIQPNGAIWPLSDLQAQLFARVIAARRMGLDAASRFDDLRRGGACSDKTRPYIDSPRHRFEVDYHEYATLLRGIIRRFDRALGARKIG